MIQTCYWLRDIQKGSERAITAGIVDSHIVSTVISSMCPTTQADQLLSTVQKIEEVLGDGGYASTIEVN